MDGERNLHWYLCVRAVLLLRMEPLEFSIVLRATSVLVITWKVGGWEGRRWGEWERGWGEEQREGKVKLWWRYIEEVAWIPRHKPVHMVRNYIPNMSN